MRGRLVLAGFDTRDSAGSYLDAVYAIVAEAPVEQLEHMMKKLVEIRAKTAPNRDTWGLEPEHRAMSAGIQPVGDDEGVTGGPIARRGKRSPTG